MHGDISIRQAGVADAAAIARIHVACWYETYSELLPAEMLADLSVGDRTARWRRILDDPAAFDTLAVFVAERDREMAGFASCGSQRNDTLKELGFAGEITALYVLRRFQRCGMGIALMREQASTLLAARFDAASLWCLENNVDARRFYERIGGRIICERNEAHGCASLLKVAYGWQDLSVLAASP